MEKRHADMKVSSSGSPLKKQKGGGFDVPEGIDLPEKESRLLAKMMEHHMHQPNFGVKYDTIRGELGIGLRVKSEVAAWKNLREQGLIKEGDIKQEFVMTEKGLEYGATPEYKEYIKDMNIISLTNEDHQTKIKKHLNPKYKERGGQIFDLLVKYGSLTAIELAAFLKTKRGSHNFSYGLKELKDKNYVELDPSPARKVKGKMLRLSDRAFLKPEDRPKSEVLDLNALAKTLADNAARKRGQESPNKDKKEITKEEKITANAKEESDVTAPDAAPNVKSEEIIECGLATKGNTSIKKVEEEADDAIGDSEMKEVIGETSGVATAGAEATNVKE